MKIHEVSMASAALNDKYSYPRVIKYYAWLNIHHNSEEKLNTIKNKLIL